MLLMSQIVNRITVAETSILDEVTRSDLANYHILQYSSYKSSRIHTAKPLYGETVWIVVSLLKEPVMENVFSYDFIIISYIKWELCAFKKCLQGSIRTAKFQFIEYS